MTFLLVVKEGHFKVESNIATRLNMCSLMGPSMSLWDLLLAKRPRKLNFTDGESSDVLHDLVSNKRKKN